MNLLFLRDAPDSQAINMHFFHYSYFEKEKIFGIFLVFGKDDISGGISVKH